MVVPADAADHLCSDQPLAASPAHHREPAPFDMNALNERDPGDLPADRHGLTSCGEVAGVRAQCLDDLSMLIQGHPTPACVKDCQLRFVAVNEAFCRMVGLSHADLIGKCVEDLEEPSMFHGATELELAVLNSGQPASQPVEIRTPDGRQLSPLCSAHAFHDGTRILGLMCWLTIPAHQTQAWALREQEMLAHLSQVAHELRSPISGIIGLAQLLLQRTQLDPQHRKWLKTIENCADHLSSTINDMVEIGMIHTGEIRLQPAPVLMGNLLQDVAHWIRPQMKHPEVVLHSHLTLPDVLDDDLTAEVDAQRLKQLLVNLLSNAVRVTRHGAIHLHCRVMPERFCNPLLARLRFEVKDTGPGMDAGRVADLLSHGTALELWSDLQGDRRGGLGLLISRRLVRALGGELKVASQLGHGTTFWFDIVVPTRPAAQLLPVSSAIS